MLPSIKRSSKVMSLQEAAGLIRDGMMLGLGGGHISEAPNAFVRELVKRGVKDLTIIPLNGTGYQTDILLGAGCVKTLYTSYVGLDYIGTAPNYRRLAESGKLDIIEFDEMGLLRGLKAAVAGLAFFPLPDGFRGTDHPQANPNFYREVKDPFTGKSVIVVPPIRPEIAVLHAPKCDIYGNARHMGIVEDIMSQAANKTIVTTEEIVPLEDTRTHYREITVYGKSVIAVVPVSYGAHPAQCAGAYPHDEDHLREYQKAGKNEETFKEYLDKYVYSCKTNEEYLEKIGIARLNSLKYW